jgi:hypothetical protein
MCEKRLLYKFRIVLKSYDIFVPVSEKMWISQNFQSIHSDVVRTCLFFYYST